MVFGWIFVEPKEKALNDVNHDPMEKYDIITLKSKKSSFHGDSPTSLDVSVMNNDDEQRQEISATILQQQPLLPESQPQCAKITSSSHLPGQEQQSNNKYQRHDEHTTIDAEREPPQKDDDDDDVGNHGTVQHEMQLCGALRILEEIFLHASSSSPPLLCLTDWTCPALRTSPASLPPPSTETEDESRRPHHPRDHELNHDHELNTYSMTLQGLGLQMERDEAAVQRKERRRSTPLGMDRLLHPRQHNSKMNMQMDRSPVQNEPIESTEENTRSSQEGREETEVAFAGQEHLDGVKENTDETEQDEVYHLETVEMSLHANDETDKTSHTLLLALPRDEDVPDREHIETSPSIGDETEIDGLTSRHPLSEGDTTVQACAKTTEGRDWEEVFRDLFFSGWPTENETVQSSMVPALTSMIVPRDVAIQQNVQAGDQDVSDHNESSQTTSVVWQEDDDVAEDEEVQYSHDDQEVVITPEAEDIHDLKQTDSAIRKKVTEPCSEEEKEAPLIVRQDVLSLHQNDVVLIEKQEETSCHNFSATDNEENGANDSKHGRSDTELDVVGPSATRDETNHHSSWCGWNEPTSEVMEMMMIAPQQESETASPPTGGPFVWSSKTNTGNNHRHGEATDKCQDEVVSGLSDLLLIVEDEETEVEPTKSLFVIEFVQENNKADTSTHIDDELQANNADDAAEMIVINEKNVEEAVVATRNQDDHSFCGMTLSMGMTTGEEAAIIEDAEMDGRIVHPSGLENTSSDIIVGTSDEANDHCCQMLWDIKAARTEEEIGQDDIAAVEGSKECDHENTGADANAVDDACASAHADAGTINLRERRANDMIVPRDDEICVNYVGANNFDLDVVMCGQDIACIGSLKFAEQLCDGGQGLLDEPGNARELSTPAAVTISEEYDNIDSNDPMIPPRSENEDTVVHREDQARRTEQEEGVVAAAVASEVCHEDARNDAAVPGQCVENDETFLDVVTEKSYNAVDIGLPDLVNQDCGETLWEILQVGRKETETVRDAEIDAGEHHTDRDDNINQENVSQRTAKDDAYTEVSEAKSPSDGIGFQAPGKSNCGEVIWEMLQVVRVENETEKEVATVVVADGEGPQGKENDGDSVLAIENDIPVDVPRFFAPDVNDSHPDPVTEPLDSDDQVQDGCNDNMVVWSIVGDQDPVNSDCGEALWDILPVVRVQDETVTEVSQDAVANQGDDPDANDEGPQSEESNKDSVLAREDEMLVDNRGVAAPVVDDSDSHYIMEPLQNEDPIQDGCNDNVDVVPLSGRHDPVNGNCETALCDVQVVRVEDQTVTEATAAVANQKDVHANEEGPQGEESGQDSLLAKDGKTLGDVPGLVNSDTDGTILHEAIDCLQGPLYSEDHTRDGCGEEINNVTTLAPRETNHHNAETLDESQLDLNNLKDLKLFAQHIDVYFDDNEQYLGKREQQRCQVPSCSLM